MTELKDSFTSTGGDECQHVTPESTAVLSKFQLIAHLILGKDYVVVTTVFPNGNETEHISEVDWIDSEPYWHLFPSTLPFPPPLDSGIKYGFRLITRSKRMAAYLELGVNKKEVACQS